MKKKLQILLASLVALFSWGSASAQTWTAAPVGPGYYILYNVGSGQYFTQGNGWGTQASITSGGNINDCRPVEIVAVGGNYFIRTAINATDYGLENLSGGTVYTDQSRGKKSTWTFTEVANDNGPVYTIMSADNHGGGAGMYLAANGENTIIDPVGDGSSSYAQWKLKLLSSNDKDAALAAMATASATSPVDVTALIENANFSLASGAWTMVANNQNLSGGWNSNRCAESWRSSNGFTLSQVISLPNGTYEVSAQAYVEEYTVTGSDLPVVYANDMTAPFAAKTGTENSMSLVSESFTSGKYNVGPITVTVTNNKLTIGARGTRSDTWNVFDNFTMKYLGAGDEATTLAELNAFSNGYAPAKNEILDFKASISATDQDNAEADFAAAVAAADAKAGAATTEEEVHAAIADLKDALNAFIETAKVNNSVDFTDWAIENATPINNLDGWTKVFEEDQGSGNHKFQPNNGLFEYWRYHFDFQQTLESLPAGLYTLTLKGYAREGSDNIVLYANGQTKDVIRVPSSSINNTGQGKTYLDNPSNGLTTIVFYLPTSQDVTIGVRDYFTQNDGWVAIRGFSLQYDQHPFLGAPAFSIVSGSNVAQDAFESDGVNVTFPNFAGEQLTADPTALSASYTVKLTDMKTNSVLSSIPVTSPYAQGFGAQQLFQGTQLAPEGFYKVSIASTTLTDGTNNWTVDDDWSTSFIVPGEAIAEGQYFFRHADSGLYLLGANDWGTRASLGSHPIDIYLSNVSNYYQLNTSISNGGNNQFLGTNLFVDSAPGNWTISRVGQNAAGNPLYVIMNEGGALVKNGNVIDQSADVFSSNAQWEIIPRDEYLAEVINNAWGDMTPWIKDWDFGAHNTGSSAWKGSPKIGGDVKNQNAEKYNTTFDVYQIVEGLPAGRYTVSVQGFYRDGSATDAAAARAGGTENIGAIFYAESTVAGETMYFSKPMLSIFDNAKTWKDEDNGFAFEAGSWFVPNSMDEASKVFSTGAYVNTMSKVVVGTDGTLKIGIKQSEKGAAGNWTIFDTFTLTYNGDWDQTPYGDLASGEYVIEDATNGGYLYVGGDEGNELTTYSRGSVFTVSKIGDTYYLQTRIGTDNDNNYVALTTDDANVNHLTVGNAVADNAVFTLSNTGWNSYSIQASDGSYLTPGAAAISAMGNLITMDATTASSWRFTKLEDYMKNDATPAIKDWGFDVNSMDASAWQGKGVNANNETVKLRIGGKKNNYVGYIKAKDFDVYQTIEGLEPGFYDLSAQIIIDDNTDPVYFYASTCIEEKRVLTNWNGYDATLNTVKKASDAIAADWGNSNGDTGPYVTNLWISGGSAATGVSPVRVGEDGKLTIGIRKTEGTVETLTVFDNFRISKYAWYDRLIFNSAPTASEIFLAGKHEVKNADGTKEMVDDKTDIWDNVAGDPNKFQINDDGLPEILLNTNDSIQNGLVLRYTGADIENVRNANYRLYANITDKAGNVYYFEADGMRTNLDGTLSDYAVNYLYDECSILLAPGFFSPNEEYTITLDRVEFIDFTDIDEKTCALSATAIKWIHYLYQSLVIKTGAGVVQDAEAAGIRRQLIKIEYAENPTTGINAMASENGNQTIYNLAGQRVSKAQKGLYIVNGKKVLVK